MPHRNTTLLPQEKSQAISALIKVTQGLLDLAESESMALMQNDMTTFAILQDEKEDMAKRYTQASHEFRARLESFRGVDRTLLNRLESLQNALGEKNRNNNSFIESVRERAHMKSQSALLAVQELGQRYGAPSPAGQHDHRSEG